MHDILFAYDFPPLGGGISRMMEELARGYPPGELVVSTGSIPDGARIDQELSAIVDRIDVPVERLRTLGGRLRWSRRAVRLARDPDARFAWCSSFRPAGLPARWAWERTGLNYGVIFYGGDLLILRPKLRRSWFKRWSYKPVLESASVLIAISHWTADLLAELLRDLALDHLISRIQVIGLGTSPDRFSPDAVGAEAFRLRRGLPEGRWLVTVARLVPHKGIDTAIEVVARLREAHPDLHYLVVGRGAHHESLARMAHDLGVDDRVHILGDVADGELPSAYALGEIYLGLSRESGLDAEGFGIALLEAAATELPVIAGLSGGIADAVADGETGRLVPPTDVAAATEAVRGLLTNSECAQRWGRNGRQRVRERFTWPHVVAEFRRVAAEHGRSPRPR